MKLLSRWVFLSLFDRLGIKPGDCSISWSEISAMIFLFLPRRISSSGNPWNSSWLVSLLVSNLGRCRAKRMFGLSAESPPLHTRSWPRCAMVCTLPIWIKTVAQSLPTRGIDVGVLLAVFAPWQPHKPTVDVKVSLSHLCRDGNQAEENGQMRRIKPFRRKNTGWWSVTWSTTMAVNCSWDAVTPDYAINLFAV